MCAVDVCKCVQLILEQIEIDQEMTVFYKKQGVENVVFSGRFAVKY